jgi:hypothetical protein
VFEARNRMVWGGAFGHWLRDKRRADFRNLARYHVLMGANLRMSVKT